NSWTFGWTFLLVPPAQYAVSVFDASRWTLQSDEFRVEPQHTNSITLLFTTSDLAVTSEPMGALVTWPSAAGATWERNPHSYTPFTNRFRSGVIEFVANSPGRLESRTNYRFNPGSGDRVLEARLVLSPSRVPQTAQSYTNSLGMAFQWVASVAPL